MPKVALIDDNGWEYIAAKLKGAFALSGHELEVFTSIDHCHKFLDAAQGRSPADVFVVDVMMPPGESYKDVETHDGLISGLYLARDIRAKFPLVPIILWSGSNLDTVRLLAVHMEKRLTKCVFVRKPFTAEKLIALVNGYFDKGRFARSWVADIWDGIVLKPSIGGLGIDVKKLLDSKSK